MEQITLDLIPKGSLPVLHASQYDDGRQWQVNLKENGEDYTLTNETIVLGVRKGDGCAVTCAVAIESGKKYVILTSTEQMCAVAGQNLAELQITKDNTKIGTLNFILQVERDPLAAGISSGTEIHDLQHQVDECVHTAFETIGASGLPYDNTESGLTADNVQAAIDEVNEKASGLPSDVYTKAETDALLADKADKATLEADYYDKAETDALLADKADASALGDYYTKSETNTKLSGKADKGSVYTTAQVNNLLNDKADKSDLGNYYTMSQTNSLLNGKADKANVYDKAYINDKFSQIGNAFTDVNTALGQKANSSDVYNKTYIDTALSAKANANAVYTKAETDAKVAGLIDDESTANNKTWSSDKISNELAALLPVDEVSGAVANFETDVVLPLIDVKAEIKAVETGTGAKSPSNPYVISGFSNAVITRSRKNLFDKSKMVISTQRFVKYGVDNYSDTLPNGKFKLQANQAYTFTFSGANSTNFESFGVYNEAGTRVDVVYNNKIATFTPVSTGAYFLAFVVSAGNWGGTWDNYDIQLEFGSTATTYEPYTATQTTIALGQTVYGGHFTQDKAGHRQFEVTFAIEDLGNISYSYNSTYSLFIAYLPSAKRTASGKGLYCLCTCFQSNYDIVWSGWANFPNYSVSCGCNYDTLINLVIKDTDYTDATVFKNAMSGVKLVYELATPYTIDLPDGEPIMAFNGVNNLWSDTNGDTTVNYKLGIQAYIDKKIAEVQALVL